MHFSHRGRTTRAERAAPTPAACGSAAPCFGGATGKRMQREKKRGEKKTQPGKVLGGRWSSESRKQPHVRHLWWGGGGGRNAPVAGRGNRTSSLLDLSALRRAKTGGIKAENRRGRGGREGGERCRGPAQPRNLWLFSCGGGSSLQRFHHRVTAACLGRVVPASACCSSDPQTPSKRTKTTLHPKAPRKLLPETPPSVFQPRFLPPFRDQKSTC